MEGSKKHRRRFHKFKFYQIQIWSDQLKEWFWVGRFIKERWYKTMPDCIEKRNLFKNTPKGRKHAGKFYLDEKILPSIFFRENLSEQNDDFNFWYFWNKSKDKPIPNPIDFFKGYSQIRFITLDDNKYYLFKYNPIKLNFGVKEYILVKINKFNKGNAKLV